MTDEQLSKISIAYREIRALMAGLGGTDDDAILVAATPLAIIDQGDSPMSLAEREMVIREKAETLKRLYRQVADQGRGLNGEDNVESMP